MSEILAANVATWPEVPLTDVADLIRGVSYPKTDARDQPADGYVPVLRATNIQDARLVLDSDLVYIAERNISAAQRLRDGDIVVATSSGSKHLVGKSAQLHRDWRGSFGAFCAGIRPKSHVESRYLALFLQSPAYWKEISKKALGVNINNLRRGDLETLMLPLPPREVQRRIVAEIEKQFSRLDEAVANLKRGKANLKRYKAAVLKAAVEGRLVPTEAELARRGGRSYETAAQLLNRILKTRRSQWGGKGKYKEPATVMAVGLPDLREGWVWATAEQVTSVITDGEHITPERSESGILLLSARNILDGHLSLDNVDFVPRYEYERIARRLVINPGDVLLSCSGSVGRSTVAPKGLVFTLVRSVAVLKPLLGMGEYLSLALRSPLLQKEIFGKKTQTAQANIFQGKIKTLCIPLPPLAEQHRVLSEVDRCLSLVRGIEVEVEANLNRSERLRQSVLSTAFADSAAGRKSSENEPASVEDINVSA